MIDSDYDVVERVLAQHPAARSNFRLLYRLVCRERGVDVIIPPHAPNFENIMRLRRRIQNTEGQSALGLVTRKSLLSPKKIWSYEI